MADVTNPYDAIASQMATDQASQQTPGVRPPPTPAPAPDDTSGGYADIAKQMVTDQAQIVNTQNSDADPDKAAHAADLSKTLGIPPAPIEQDIKPYAQQAQTAQNNAILQQNPIVAKWVAQNAPAARLAQDDYNNLSAVSKAWQALGMGGLQAQLGNEIGRLGFEKQVGLGSPEGDQQIRQLQGDLQQASPELTGIYDKIKDFGNFGGGLLDNFLQGAIPGSVAGSVVGAAGGAPIAGLGAVPGYITGAIVGSGIGLKADMARVAAGNTYLQLKSMKDSMGNPIDDTAAQVGSIIAGAGTYAIAGMGMGKINDAVASNFMGDAVKQALTEPGFATAFKNVGVKLAQSGLTFGTLNLGMEGANILGEQVAQGISQGNFQTILNDPAQRDEVITRLLGAAENGLMLGPIAEIPMAGMSFAGDMAHARQAEANSSAFQNVMDAAGKSKLAERSPDAFTNFMQSQTNGTSAENIYVPAEKIRELYQSKGIDPTAPNDPLFGFVKDMPEQLRQAQLTGGDVVIPTADYIANLAKKPLGMELRDDIRMSPDGMSLNQARETMAAINEQVKQRGQDMVDNPPQASPEDQIKSEIQNQLMGAGGFKPDQIDALSTTYAKRYAARAAQFGEDPFASFSQKELGIVRDHQPIVQEKNGYEVDDQGNIVQVLPSSQFKKISKKDLLKTVTLDDLESQSRSEFEGKHQNISQLLDLIKKPQQKEAAKAPNLSAYLRKLGGLRDDGGDLKAMDASKNYIGLINNKKGLAIDDAALRAQQAGYFEDHGFPAGGDRIDTSSFKELVRRDLSQRDVRPVDHAAEGDDQSRRVAEDFERVLDDHDIAIGDRDNADIIKEMAEKGLLNEPERQFDQAAVANRPGDSAVPEQQLSLEGTHPSAVQLAKSLEVDGNGKIRAKSPQLSADEGLFAPKDDKQRTLFQGERGSISLQNTNAMIRLFEKGDISTMLHESGHLWLEELKSDAARADAPEQLKKDWETVRDFIGAKDGEDVQTDAHEKFARTVEHYFMEGKAPSDALRKAFDTFSKWLKRIYKNVRNLDAPINDDIRRVLDRMLATEGEIQQTEAVQNLRPMFSDAKTAGMTDAEFAAYKKMADTARTKASEELLNKTMAAIRKEKTKEWKKQYDGLKPKVENDINSRQDIKAMQYMKTGKLYDAPEGSTIPAMKFDREALDAIRPGTKVDDLPRSVPPMVKDGGFSPDDIAAMIGYDSGRKLVDDLVRLRRQENALRARDIKTPLRDYLVDRETKQQLLEKNGDLLSEGGIKDEAMKIMHNASRSELIGADVAALARQVGKNPIPTKVVRDWAEGVIGDKTVGDATKIHLYAREEARAGREAERALLKGDKEEAYSWKQKQQFNHALMRAAMDAEADVESGLRRMKYYANHDTIDSMNQAELEHIHSLLEKIDLHKASQKELARRESFSKWVEKNLQDGQEVKAPADLLEKIKQQNYSEMKMNDFRQVSEAVDNIANIGRLKQKLIDGKERRDFRQAIADTVAQSVGLTRRSVNSDESYLREARKGVDKMNAKWLSFKHNMRLADASLIKMEQLIQWLDRNNPNGQFNRLGFRPIKDARTAENNLMAALKPEIGKAVANLDKATIKGWRERIDTDLTDPRDGQKMSLLKSQIVAMALNTGNDSSMYKLTKGYGWTEDAVRAVLDRHMTEGEWKYVQHIWDIMDHHLWPVLAERETRMSGIAPEKIEARTVSTRFGDMRGGYYPVVYDALRFDPSAGRETSGLFDQTFGSLSSKLGATIERTEAAHPILLSQNILPRHIESVVHDVSFRESVMSVDRFFRDGSIKGIVDTVFGPEYSAQIRPWLRSIANEKIWDERGLQFWDNAAKQLRINATLVNLGYNPITVAVHSVTAMSNSIAEIGAKDFAAGAHAFFGTPKQMAEARDMVYAHSDFMKHRMNELDRDIRDGLKQLEGQHGIISEAKRFAYYGISMGDMASAMPTWMGAYNKFLRTMPEDDAVYAADQAVRNAHGSGGVEDISAIQRGNEFQKLTTMFYSFWNHFYNRQRDIARRAGDIKSTGDFAQVMARSVFYFIAPMLIHGIIRPQPNQGDEGLGAWAAKEVGMGAVSGIPVLRDIANAALTGKDYSMSPAVSAINAVIQSFKDAGHATGLKQGNVSDKWVKHAVQTAGYITGLPGAGQLSRYAQSIWDVTHGIEPTPSDTTDWIHTMLYGNLPEQK